ncbi:MAG: hypothetical protein KTR30_06925 [Saprospiraceae bacterium]|nr:hypothetical protein [Saprospiraceae bacterium]
MLALITSLNDKGALAIPKKLGPWSLALLMLAALLYLGLRVEQSDFYPLIGIYSFLFLAYLWIYRTCKIPELGFWLGLAILVRLSLVFLFPLLSDDVYRFIWDGRLVTNGYNPFNYLPSTLITEGPVVPGLDQSLYEALNSPEYFTIYPPIAQATFAVATYLFPDSLYGAAVVMKLFLFAFEVGSLILILQLLLHWELPLKNSLLYALNPLIIIEVCGNLHYEGAMVFFLLLSIWLVVKGRFWLSSAMLAFSVASKLLPLMFFPFWVKRLGHERKGNRSMGLLQQLWQAIISIDFKRNLLYFLLCFIILLALFFPLLNGVFVQNFGDSIGLYFQKFEFNASVYYLLRWVGYQTKGYNLIATIGPRLALGTFTGIILLFLWERKVDWKSLPLKLLWAICLYLLFTTTVHPWYTSLPIVLCLFTRFRFPILWSGLIYFTYINYSYPVYHENLTIVAIEYSLVFALFLFELFRGRNAKPILS